MLWPITDPPRVRPLGMRPDLLQMMQGPGHFENIENGRITDGSIIKRNGRAKIGSTPNPLGAGAYCIGNFGVMCAGTEYNIQIWRGSGGTAAIYKFNVSSGAWTELTATSGQYGDTRFTVGAPGMGTCCVSVRDPRNGKEYILVGNSGSPPSSLEYWRVYEPSTGFLAIHQPITSPSPSNGTLSKPKFRAYATVSNYNNWSFTNSGANWTGANSGTSTTDNYIVLTKNTVAATNPTVKITYSSTVDMSTGRQCGFLFDSKTAGWWDQVKLEISEDDVTYYTIWDPSTGLYGREAIPVDGGGSKEVAAFGLDHIDAANRNAIKYVKLTYLITSAPSASIVCNLYMFFGSGTAIGERYYKGGYVNSASRAESEPVDISNTQPELVRNQGGAQLNNLRIPWDRRLYYDYDVTYLNPSTAQMQLGVDTFVLYANDPGDTSNRYFYVSTTTFAEYSGGSWGFTGGTSALAARTIADTTASADRKLNSYAPPPGTLGLPRNPWCAVAANQRLFIGSFEGAGTIGSPSFGQLWASQKNNPFHYRQYPVPGDESSAYCDLMQGEYPYFMKAVAASNPGFSVVYIGTNKGIQRMAGILTSQLSKRSTISTYGTIYKNSAVECQGDIYYVDRKKKARVIRDDRVAPIASHSIESEFSLAYTAEPCIVGWTDNDIVHWAIDTTTSGSVTTIRKTKAVSYDVLVPKTEISDGWTRDSWPSGQTTEYVAVLSGQVVAAGSNLYVYELEKAAQLTDDGTATNLVIETNELVHDDAQFSVSRIQVKCDDDAGTLACTASYFAGGTSTLGGTMSLNGANSRNWLEGVMKNATGRSRGSSASLLFTFAIDGGKRIYGLTALLEEFEDGPTRA